MPGDRNSCRKLISEVTGRLTKHTFKYHDSVTEEQILYKRKPTKISQCGDYTIKLHGSCNHTRRKVLHGCSLQIFCSRCLTTLCNSKVFITATSCLRSRTCLTRLICARLDTQDGVVFKTRSANISCGSRTTPRSLAQDVTARSFAEIDILKSGRYNPVPSWVFWHHYVSPIQTMDHGSTTLDQTRPLAKKG